MPLVFFRRPKPRQFNYRPIYYDQEKEEIEERMKEIEAIRSGDPHARLKAEIRRKWQRGNSNEDKRYNYMRYALYFVVFALSVYLLFFTDFLTRFLTIFLGNQ